MSKSIQLKNINNEKMYPHPYYPVGSIYLSINNINPTKWYGGTWELVAQGRTLIGVDTNDSDFNKVMKTGGAKTHSHTTGDCILTVQQIPNHRHVGIYNADGTAERYGGWGETTTHTGTIYEHGLTQWEHLYTGYVGGGQAHNHGNTNVSSNLPPFFTCYIWCRTA